MLSLVGRYKPEVFTMDLNSPSDGWTPMPPMLVIIVIAIIIIIVITVILNITIIITIATYDQDHSDNHHDQEARMWQQCTTTVIDGNMGKNYFFWAISTHGNFPVHQEYLRR